MSKILPIVIFTLLLAIIIILPVSAISLEALREQQYPPANITINYLGIGPQGETGIQGPQGIQGIQGVQGDKGDKGDQGIQGIANMTAGPQGIQGIQGVQGDKGDKGDQGIQGIANMTAGPQGIRGIQGVQGIQGIQGIPGLDANASTMYPIDTIYITASTTDPSSSLGFGTWEQIFSILPAGS